MSASTIIRAQVDGDQKARAEAVLGDLGLTIGDAVALLIDRIADRGDLPAGLAADPTDYDAWFNDEVQLALDDQREAVADEDAKAHFARRRAIALQRLQRGEK